MSALMVERVAKAIHSRRGHIPWPDKNSCESCMLDAKAAITAMREPTEEMIYRNGINDSGKAADLWKLMIDAALKD